MHNHQKTTFSKKLKTLFIATLMPFACFTAIGQPTNTAFVWADEQAEGRLEFVYFRYDVVLDSLPETAMLHFYASNLYHLKVNGTMINFGPLRAFPEAPRYDSYNLAPYLNEGENTIAVKVLREGVYNYQMPQMPGGFIAWGEIASVGKTYAFNTPGQWKCTTTDAYNTQTPKFSFATGAMEVYDARKEVNNWDQSGADLTKWKSPVAVQHQDYWGTLQPRPFPHLTQEELSAQYLMGVYSFDKSEELYYFQSKTPDEETRDYGHGWPHFAYTYIYSHEDQQVQAGSFWGDFYLNGELITQVEKTEKQNPVRSERTFDLKQGWNYLFVAQKPIWGAWDFYMALPKSANITVSADKKRNGNGPVFYVAGPFEREEEQRIAALSVPFEPGELPGDLSAEWRPQLKQPYGANPARDAAWLEFDQKQAGYPMYKTRNIEIPANQERALVFDLGRKTLGRIILEADAPEGTLFDVIISEDLNGEKIYVYKRIMVSAGSRFIAVEGENHFEHFKPYGMRFVQVNIRNHNAPVTIKKLAAVEQVYPFEKKGSFECSDPYFNALWEMGWRTLRVCAEDTYTDTPFRERGLYAGDMLPQFGITQTTSGDPRLLEYSLTFLNGMYADRQNPDIETSSWPMGRHNEFPYAALHAWYWSYQTRGNIPFAREQWMQYKNLIDWSFANQNEVTGLIWADNVFIEWTKLEKNNTYNTAYNASVAGACLALAEIAVELGYGAYKQELEEKAKQLTKSINTHLWDESKGAYWDGINQGGKKMDTYYPISSAFCSLFGVADPDKQKRILAHYADVLPDIGDQHRAMLSSAYGSFYVLADLFQQGEAGMAEAFYRKYWLPQVVWGDTNFENFKAMEGGGQGTLSHAWSGHATYFLSTEVLGVQMGFPQAYNPGKIVIAPQSETLSWAKGTVPHPLGLVTVEWQVKGDQLFLQYSAPKGADLVVKPRGRLSDLELVLMP